MRALIFGLLMIRCGSYSTEAASVGISQQIAPCIDQQNDVLLPVFDECSQFYSCKNGKAILISCMEGLYFDPETKNCTEASKSDCIQEQPIAISSDVKPKAPEIPNYICLGKAIGSLVPSRNNCSEYYSCIGSNPSLRTCGMSSHFDSYSRSCIPVNQSDCVIRVKLETTTTRKPELIETVCKGMFDGEKFPVPGNCSKYFDCFGHKAYEKTCGKKHFYPVSRTCIDPEISECFEGYVRVKPVSTDSIEIGEEVAEENNYPMTKNATDLSASGNPVSSFNLEDLKRDNVNGKETT